MLLAGDIGGTKTDLAVFSLEHGLFLSLATDLIVAGDDGIRHITRDRVDSR